MFIAAVLLFVATVSADPFIYNVYSSSGSQSQFGNPYTRDEVYIRRPGASPYYSGMGNQMMMLGGGGMQGMQGLSGLQGIQSMQGMGMQPYGASSSLMGVGSYGSSFYNKPRFAADMMGGMGGMTGMSGMGQPLMLNGYPMYPKTSGYPMVIPIGMGSYGSSPTVYQGPTVSRLPFQAAAKRARFFY